MVFEDWELEKIIECLKRSSRKSNSMEFDLMILKIEQVRLTSVNKRYTLRTTDWLVENGKKSKNRKKRGDIENGII